MSWIRCDKGGGTIDSEDSPAWLISARDFCAETIEIFPGGQQKSGLTQERISPPRGLFLFHCLDLNGIARFRLSPDQAGFA